jgi:hypothetical protein
VTKVELIVDGSPVMSDEMDFDREAIYFILPNKSVERVEDDREDGGSLKIFFKDKAKMEFWP